VFATLTAAPGLLEPFSEKSMQKQKSEEYRKVSMHTVFLFLQKLVDLLNFQVIFDRLLKDLDIVLQH
jgi:hypothetical protein